MFEDRLAEFSRERLDGRSIPADLRMMLVAQWENRTDFRDLLGVAFFEPGRVSPLLDTSYLREEELADPEMQAVNAGAAALAEYVKLVAEGGKGWIGYWLHPDEPADRPVPLLELDTEFTFWGLSGRTLAEACAVEAVRYEEDQREAFSVLKSRLAQLGLDLDADDYDAVYEPDSNMDPGELMDELTEAERERRGLA
jgi:hypothetical protein